MSITIPTWLAKILWVNECRIFQHWPSALSREPGNNSPYKWKLL